MKLTKAESEICKRYSEYDNSGRVHCSECPLLINKKDMVCYANIDGRTREARMAKRYNQPRSYEPGETPCCANCKWWEKFNGACCNPGSEERADFTASNFCCKAWERGETI